nr:MAG TPA: hypothetical protein [Caudoviricetes sp.]DAT37225.1 MAG TPA: hypothetical protein [Caudoviricetes sp.]
MKPMITSLEPFILHKRMCVVLLRGCVRVGRP